MFRPVIFLHILFSCFLTLLFTLPVKASDPHPCHKIDYWLGSVTLDAAYSMIEEIYDISDLCSEFNHTSLKKAQHNLLTNNSAANGWRSEYFINQFSDDIVYTDPVFTVNVTLFLNEEKYGTSPDLFSVTGQKIGYFLGDVYAVEELKKLGGIPVHGESFDKVIKSFLNGRTTAIIVPNTIFLDQTNIQNINVNYTSHDLEPVYYRHVLHKDHEGLIPILNQAIPKMLQNGTLEERRAKLLSEKIN
ncbi:hypothetical protein [Curvivirga sp.]|uniref:hypothetical protein n=1 Tax=Curvivirga sp. TaxID=2856848 RepID=UPI003B58EE93